MKKPVQDEQQEKETLVDWLKGIGLVGIPLWIVLLIDKLNGEDFYDYSDYYDGLDGEHSDIDYNEIRDYFED